MSSHGKTGVLIEKGHVRNKFFSEGGRNVSCLHLGGGQMRKCELTELYT